MVVSHSTVISSSQKPLMNTVLSSGRSQALIPPPACQTQLRPRPTTTTNAAHDQHSRDLLEHPKDQDSMYASYSSTSLAALNSTCGSASARPSRPQLRTPSSQSATAVPRSSSGTSRASTNTTVIPLLPGIQPKIACSHCSRLQTGSPESRRRRTTLSTRARLARLALRERHHRRSLLRAWRLCWEVRSSRQRARRGSMPWTTRWKCWRRTR